VGFCLQEWFGAHRFETWRESYVWIYWIMVLSTITGALIGLYSYSYHKKKENWTW
jgi:glycerol uptake facilitator-like aquaporin